MKTQNNQKLNLKHQPALNGSIWSVPLSSGGTWHPVSWCSVVWISIAWLPFFFVMTWDRNKYLIGLPITWKLVVGISLQPLPGTKSLSDSKTLGGLTSSNHGTSGNTRHGKPGAWRHSGSACTHLAQVTMDRTPSEWPDWKEAVTSKFTWRYTWEMCKTLIFKRGFFGRNFSSRQRAIFLFFFSPLVAGNRLSSLCYSWGFSKEFSINFFY